MNAAAGGPITVIFPMAGQAAHSGYKFKPFIELSDEPVIAAVVRPFQKWRHAIKRFVFVTLAEQEAEFSVRARLKAIFPELPFDLVCLDKPTEGPAQTLAHTVAQENISGPAIVCDSDHSIDVDPLFERIVDRSPADCLFPIWSLRGENLKSWSVAACDHDLRVTAIAEKELPAVNGDFFGVVGCYYFADIAHAAELVHGRSHRYLSQAIKDLIAAGRRVSAVSIERAEFFGDTRGLREARARRDRFPGTIFCDLDGTVIEHQDVPRYDQPIRLLPGSKEKLASWMDEGYQVVLTTARHQSEQAELEKALRDEQVPFHRLIMGLPSGPRYVINDRKPSAMLVPQVVSYEISRNEGITHIAIPSVVPTVLKRFNGASFSDTLLVEDDEKRFVRKRVLKRDHLTLGYAKLKNQYRTLERFSHFSDIVPALYGDHDNSLEYYFDIEYLARHQTLTRLSTAELQDALGRLLGVFEERVYGVKTSTNSSGADWLSGHCARKIFPKLEAVQSHPVLGRLVNGGELCIDGRTYPCLNDLLSAVLEPPCHQGPGAQVAVGRTRRPDFRKCAVPLGRRARDRHGRRRLPRRSRTRHGQAVPVAGRPLRRMGPRRRQAVRTTRGRPVGAQADPATARRNRATAVPGPLVADSRLCRRPGLSQGTVLHGPAPDPHDSLPPARQRGASVLHDGLGDQVDRRGPRGAVKSG